MHYVLTKLLANKVIYVISSSIITVLCFYVVIVIGGFVLSLHVPVTLLRFCDVVIAVVLLILCLLLVLLRWYVVVRELKFYNAAARRRGLKTKNTFIEDNNYE